MGPDFIVFAVFVAFAFGLTALGAFPQANETEKARTNKYERISV
jgi:hypothetical protein